MVKLTSEEQEKYHTGKEVSWLLKEQLKCEHEFDGEEILAWLIIVSPFIVGTYLLLRKKRQRKN